MRILRKLLPNTVRTALKCTKLLQVDYGQWRSAQEQRPVDRDGHPIPWYTYPAIELIRQWDIRDRVAFEYGCGNSTLFWAQRVRNVFAIEHAKAWHDEVSVAMPDNVRIQLLEDENDYVNAIERIPIPPDIVVVDGRWRTECCKKALDVMEPGGLIVLDNSDWYVHAASVLRTAGLLQVDLSGFGPVNSYTWTTSFFFDRDFRVNPAEQYQPSPGVGAVKDKREVFDQQNRPAC